MTTHSVEKSTMVSLSRKAMSQDVVVERKERMEKHTKHSASVTTYLSTSREDSDASLHQLTEEFARKLVVRTEERVTQAVSKSALRKRCRIHKIERFTWADLNVGNFVAGGGFSDVFAINSFNKQTALTAGENSDKHYVLKHLNPKLVTDHRKLAVGAKDLALEAHFLSSLNHKNIIGLRGWPTAGLAGFIETGRVEGFFLVLDRLVETLTNRIGSWHREAREQRVNGSIRSSTRRKFFARRLKAAIQVASALEYLHENRIIYRDLKPGNIGFDRGGTLKLFDFGLAVELPENSSLDSTFNLPGKTGTARYMALEIIEAKPYNVKADVFSFSVLLWEIIALQKPYKGLPGEVVMQQVVNNARPQIPQEWPTELRELLKRGWTSSIEARPHMKYIRQELLRMRVKCLSEVSEGN